jgi:hypothetical protein
LVVLVAVGCQSNPCEPGLLGRLLGRQRTFEVAPDCCMEGSMMMGDPAMAGGPILSAPPNGGMGVLPPPVVDAYSASRPRPLPDGQYAKPLPYTPDEPAPAPKRKD